MNRRDDLLPTMYKQSEIIRHVEERIKNKKRFGLFALDLDNFKQVNDAFGHDKGNDVLKKLAELIDHKFTRKTDTLELMDQDATSVGRTGGDEAVLTTELFEPEEGGEGHQRVASIEEQMMATKGLILQVETELITEFPELMPLGFGISVGGVVSDPAIPVEADTLFIQADTVARTEKLQRKYIELTEERIEGLLEITVIADRIGIPYRNLPAYLAAIEEFHQP
jgi:diguanylate cyclase (GGDEF)-like protein